MFNREQHLEKLRQLHDKIERMSSGKEKVLLIANYITYCNTLYKLFPGEVFPFDSKEFFDEGSCKKHLKYCAWEVQEIFNSIDMLKYLFTEVSAVNQEHGLTRIIKLKDDISSLTGTLLVNEFFSSLPENIEKIFHEVFNGNLFFTHEDNAEAFNVDYWNNGIVKCQAKFKNYYTYMGLVHEIGHCYEFRLNKQSNNFNIMRPDIEVPGIFMEIIFNQFVDKYLYGEEYGINSLLYRQSMWANWISYQELFLINSQWIDITGEKELLGIMNYHDLTKSDRELLDRHGITLSDEMKTDGIFGLSLDVRKLRYTISNLIAIYFADIYSQDKEAGLRMLKDYLMLPPNVTLEDRLGMYEITGDSYKKMVKKVSDYAKGKYLL